MTLVERIGSVANKLEQMKELRGEQAVELTVEAYRFHAATLTIPYLLIGVAALFVCWLGSRLWWKQMIAMPPQVEFNLVVGFAMMVLGGLGALNTLLFSLVEVSAWFGLFYPEAYIAYLNAGFGD